MCHPGTCISSTGNSYTSSTRSFSCYISELIGNCLQAIKNMLIFEIFPPEFQRIDTSSSCHYIDLNFPCKGICIVIRSPPRSCSELMNRWCTVFLTVMCDVDIRNIISCFRSTCSGIIHLIVPEFDQTRFIYPRFKFYYSGRMECIKKKFFITGPHEHNRFPCHFCEFCCLNPLLIFPLTAESSAYKRCYNPNLVGRQSKFTHYTVP